MQTKRLTMLFLRHTKENGPHSEEVTPMLSKETETALIVCGVFNSRIIRIL